MIKSAHRYGGRRGMRRICEVRWTWISRGPTRLNAAGQVVSNNRAARRAAR